MHLCMAVGCPRYVSDGLGFCPEHGADEARRTARRDVEKLRSGGAIP